MDTKGAQNAPVTVKVPRRRQSLPKQAAELSTSPKREATAILAQRRRLMLDIAARERSAQNSKFVANAKQLLTRWWATADWGARRDLLKNADWLLRMAQHRGDEESAADSAAARR